MLAQNFKSATDLEITEPQKEALMKTLVLLETGKLKHVDYRQIRPTAMPSGYAGLFSMGFTYGETDCGTAGCIRGTAQLVGDVEFNTFDLPSDLHDLFYDWSPCKTFDPSTTQAAIALRSYLTTGAARWDLAAASASEVSDDR